MVGPIACMTILSDERTSGILFSSRLYAHSSILLTDDGMRKRLIVGLVQKQKKTMWKNEDGHEIGIGSFHSSSS